MGKDVFIVLDELDKTLKQIDDSEDVCRNCKKMQNTLCPIRNALVNDIKTQHLANKNTFGCNRFERREK